MIVSCVSHSKYHVTKIAFHILSRNVAIYSMRSIFFYVFIKICLEFFHISIVRLFELVCQCSYFIFRYFIRLSNLSPIIANFQSKVTRTKVQSYSIVTIIIFIIFYVVISTANCTNRMPELSFIHAYSLKYIRNPLICY